MSTQKVVDQLKGELERMESEGIIMKQPNAAQWVNSLVCVPKSNGKLRICLDPKPMNKTVRRPYHYSPMVEEILHKRSNCRYFSTMYQPSGYWNIEMHPEGISLLTFNSTFGRYSYESVFRIVQFTRCVSMSCK